MRRYWMNPVEMVVFVLFAVGFSYSGYRFYRETESFTLASHSNKAMQAQFTRPESKTSAAPSPDRMPASKQRLEPLIPLGY